MADAVVSTLLWSLLAILGAGMSTVFAYIFHKECARVDSEKMKRVIINLIKNAVDAMPTGGTLTMKNRTLEKRLEIAISDTGTGIPEETQEKIWQPLFTTKAKGVGLGLCICKRIVEAHKGNISVESKVGEGTTFKITFPLEPQLNGGGEIWVKSQKSLLSTTMKA